MSAPTHTVGNSHEAAPDLSDLDGAKAILDAVGKEVLEKILRDYIELGGGSIAIYDKNGGYVLPVVASRYCSKLWEASLHSCGTTDIASALRSGKWLCHEKSWAAAQAAIEAGEASEASHPGLRVHAVPIRAGTGVIGAISIGYGEPPGEDGAIREVAAEYGLTLDELARLDRENPPLPAWLLARLQKNVSTLATLIGKIVEARLAEKAARTSEARLHALVEFAADAMVLARASGEIVAVNAQTEKLSGYSRDELLGQPIELLIPEGLRAAHVRHRAGYASNPYPRAMDIGLELHCRRKDGSEVPVEISLSPIRSGDELLVMSTIRDVAERARGKRALEASERKFRDIFERSLNSIAIISARNGRYLAVNPQWERLTGFGMHEVVGRTPGELNLFANKETYRRALCEFEIANCVLNFEAEFRRKTGETFWVLFSAVQVELDDAPCILSFIQEITEQRRAQRELESQAAELGVWKRRHDAIIRASGQALYIWNVVTGELAWEGNFKTAMGYDVLPATLDQWIELVHPEDRQTVEAEIRRVLQTRSPVRLVFRLRHADGSYRLVDSTGYFIEARPGVHEVVGFLVDVTERRALEEAERRST
ncbi:MAG: PAS domain S-box protein, partial [Deltaproteobacteria bacterium]|nr:PAS domain S-box protein [Deltaproteobacteria bacterium]